MPLKQGNGHTIPANDAAGREAVLSMLFCLNAMPDAAARCYPFVG